MKIFVCIDAVLSQPIKEKNWRWRVMMQVFRCFNIDEFRSKTRNGACDILNETDHYSLSPQSSFFPFLFLILYHLPPPFRLFLSSLSSRHETSPIPEYRRRFNG